LALLEGRRMALVTNERSLLPPLVCHGHSRPIVDIQYSEVTEDGVFLSSASKDKLPMVRNGDTGDWIGTFEGHKGAVWQCNLNQGATHAASASGDFSCKLWDALTGDELHEFVHKHVVRTANFSRGKGDRLVTGGLEKKLRVYDLERPEAAPMVIATEEPVRNAVFHLDDKCIICSMIDAPGMHVYDARTGAKVRVLATPGPVLSMDFDSLRRVLTSSDGETVRTWDAIKMEETKSLKTGMNLEGASFCPEVDRMAVGGSSGKVGNTQAESGPVKLYKWSTGEELLARSGHHGAVHCVRFSPRHDSYASCSTDGTIRLWATDLAMEAAKAKEDGAAKEQGQQS